MAHEMGISFGKVRDELAERGIDAHELRNGIAFVSGGTRRLPSESESGLMQSHDQPEKENRPEPAVVSEPDDVTFVGRLLEALRSDSPTPPEGLAARSIRRARLDVLIVDVVDFVSLRFLHRRTGDDGPRKPDE